MKPPYSLANAALAATAAFPPPASRRPAAFFLPPRATTTTTATRRTTTTTTTTTRTTPLRREDNNQPKTAGSRRADDDDDDDDGAPPLLPPLRFFHPLGPPAYLSELPVGGTTRCRPLPSSSHPPPSSFTPPGGDDDGAGVITRLSSRPDVFLVRGQTSAIEAGALMDGAIRGGMKVAGTRTSKEGAIRRGSYLAWIDPYCIVGGVGGGGGAPGVDDGNDCGDAGSGSSARLLASVARDAIARSRRRFSHDAMNDALDLPGGGGGAGSGDGDDDGDARAEDVQVARYEAGGGSDLHHDGYGRYLTVLSYLNGVGGTYFPFGDGEDDDDEGAAGDDGEDGASAMTAPGASSSVDGRRGILIVGREGHDAYATADDRRRIVYIGPGDALAFYNYDADGARDMRSVHGSLTSTEEKWISTCWFRSGGLTGPFGSLRKARLLDEWTTREEEREEERKASPLSVPIS
jgi:hypothetical protein